MFYLINLLYKNFQFAKFFKQGTENQIYQTTDIGTLEYITSEIMKSNHYSNKIDSYSVLLNELLTIKENNRVTYVK